MTTTPDPTPTTLAPGVDHADFTPPTPQEEAAREIAAIDQMIADVKGRRDQLVEFLIQSHEKGEVADKANYGDVNVSFSAGQSRLNAAAIETAYPAADNPQLYASKLDTKAVRAAFAPNVLAQFETQTAPGVKVTKVAAKQ